MADERPTQDPRFEEWSHHLQDSAVWGMTLDILRILEHLPLPAVRAAAQRTPDMHIATVLYALESFMEVVIEVDATLPDEDDDEE
jgi:hypothetical protein